MPSILDALAGGDRKSIGRAREVADMVLADSTLLPLLVEGVLQSDAIVRARSSVALKLVALSAPGLVQPFKKRLMSEMAVIDQWEVRENFCIILPKLQLTKAEIAEAAVIFKSYLDYYSGIVRTCAMQGLVDLCLHEPGLRTSVQPVIEKLTVTGTAAMRARGRKLLKTLEKMVE